MLIALALWAVSEYFSRPIFDEMLQDPPPRALSMAPLDQAVTLARTTDGRVLLLTSANAEGVSAVDINRQLSSDHTDAVQAYRALGYDRLQFMATSSHMMQRLSWSELGSPVDGPEQQIAAGTNYRAHAEEVGHEGEPFLFPKLSAPTAWNDPVSAGGRLDYEVELCAVPLEDYTGEGSVQLGYLLCNDFTDRWQLVRDIDLDGPMGLTGFPLSKGGASRLPVGPLLVIPRRDGFHKQVQLSLYVDGALRQQAPAEQMIWSPAETLSRALEACPTAYDLEGEDIYLGTCNGVAAGTLVLTGTPAGVMFSPATIWAPWAYLRRGQVVQAFGTYLGKLENPIVAP